MEENQDFGSKLADLSLGIIGKVSDKYLTATATSAQPIAPGQPMELSIPSATNQTIGFFNQYKIYLIVGAIAIVGVFFIWRKK